MAIFTAEGIIVAIYSYLQIKEPDYKKPFMATHITIRHRN